VDRIRLEQTSSKLSVRAWASLEDHLKVVNPIPKNMPEITAAIREEINYHGVSVIIPRRECMQTLQRHLKQKKAAAK
jgi:indolepyruvate ferredoxin oxidoreductase alpha subunit